MSSDEVGLQLAILKVASESQARSPERIHQALIEELTARSIPVPPGPWMTEVVSSIAEGTPYVISPTALSGCEEQLGVTPTPGDGEIDSQSSSPPGDTMPKSLERQSDSVWPESDLGRVDDIMRALQED